MTTKQLVNVAENRENEATIRRYPKILVVDDVQDNLDLISELFEGEPWNVKTVDNAKDAWAIIKRWVPNLVVLDIRMPDYNGHHLCTAIRMKPELNDLAVIFLTAEHTSEDEKSRGLQMGAVDYICKPIDGKALRDRVRTHLPKQCQPIPDSKAVQPAVGFMDEDSMAAALTEFDLEQQPTILAIDDIADNLDLIVEVFEDEPWNVLTAQNAREAWALLKQSPPDVVLLDIQMPEIDGHQLCTAIRKLPQASDVHIIFVTAERLSPGDVVNGLELGADDYICKPFNSNELRARVRTALRRKYS